MQPFTNVANEGTISLACLETGTETFLLFFFFLPPQQQTRSVMPECSRVARPNQEDGRRDPGGDVAEAGGGGRGGGALDSFGLKQVALPSSRPPSII